VPRCEKLLHDPFKTAALGPQNHPGDTVFDRIDRDHGSCIDA